MMHVFVYEMTEERKKLMEKVASEVIDIMAKKLAGPEECMICMRYMLEALEESVHYKLAGKVALENFDPKGPKQ